MSFPFADILPDAPIDMLMPFRHACHFAAHYFFAILPSSTAMLLPDFTRPADDRRHVHAMHVV